MESRQSNVQVEKSEQSTLHTKGNLKLKPPRTHKEIREAPSLHDAASPWLHEISSETLFSTTPQMQEM